MIDKPHDTIDELLPWYATGRLSPADRARVEKALKADPELQRRLDLAFDELDETVRVNEHLGAPSPHVLEDLFAKIDAEPARPFRARGAGAASWLARKLMALTPRTLTLATIAATALVLVQAAVIGTMVTQRGAGYSTASYSKFESPEGSFVLIGFTDTATAAQVLEFLKANQAVIVDGPRAGGLFKLRVAPDKLPRGTGRRDCPPDDGAWGSRETRRAGALSASTVPFGDVA